MKRVLIFLIVVASSISQTTLQGMQDTQPSAPLLTPTPTDPIILINQPDDLPVGQPQSRHHSGRAISPTAATETSSAASTVITIRKDSISSLLSSHSPKKNAFKKTWLCRNKETILFVTIIVAASAWFLYHLVTGIENKASQIIPRMDAIIQRMDGLEQSIVKFENIIQNVTGQEISIGQQIGQQIIQSCQNGSISFKS